MTTDADEVSHEHTSFFLNAEDCLWQKLTQLISSGQPSQDVAMEAACRSCDVEIRTFEDELRLEIETQTLGAGRIGFFLH